jgi:Antitoxin Xre/MbcA/ParS C-terminal toxin-binding domain/Antitoxin Xre-like helix-turn-helix domain
MESVVRRSESVVRRSEDEVPAGPPQLRPDPAVRRRLSGPALRTFFTIAAAWRLSVTEQRGLLGWPATSTFHKYKAGDHATLAFDTLTRLSLVIGIYKSLQVLYPEPAFADGWVRMPNSHPLFAGRPALTLMVDGGIDGLFKVRRLLDSRRGG